MKLILKTQYVCHEDLLSEVRMYVALRPIIRTTNLTPMAIVKLLSLKTLSIPSHGNQF